MEANQFTLINSLGPKIKIYLGLGAPQFYLYSCDIGDNETASIRIAFLVLSMNLSQSTSTLNRLLPSAEASYMYSYSLFKAFYFLSMTMMTMLAVVNFAISATVKVNEC